MTSFLGIDLAWGYRSPTGWCLVRHGRVVGSGTVTTDAEILDVCPDGPVVAGVDAPIVVANEHGRRPCDAAVSRCFGRFHAGVYPANRRIPWLARPRAGQLAARLGWSLVPADARGADPRVMLETYPHAAMVVLFGLERILPYKYRTGRTVEDRQSAFVRLLDGLRGLADADPPLDPTTGPRWEEIEAAVTTADRHAALDRVEHELDAHVCAYVALQHAHGPPGATAVAGDLSTGTIVVPVDGPLADCLAGER